MPEPARAPVLVAAGGTGGHLFPAEALAAALGKRGIAVHLVTDRRAVRYGGAIPDAATHVVASATLRARNPIAATRTAAMLGVGLVQAWALIGRLKPAAVIGFGGYPTIPPLLAAAWRGIPTLIHDANAVIGRANRLLAPRVTAIATTFPDVFRAEPRLAAKATLTGNPVRPAVVAAAATPYPAVGDPLRLLIFGGSQGARIMADIVPAAIGRLNSGLRARLAIVQQAREEDLGRVRVAYENLGVAAEVAPFFPDLPARMAASHLVVARVRRLDRRRACGDRPAGDPRTAAARARSGPICQCRRPGRRRRRDSTGAAGIYAAAAGRRACRAGGGAGAARRHGGGGAIPGPARRRRPARRPRARGGGAGRKPVGSRRRQRVWETLCNCRTTSARCISSASAGSA